MYATLGPPLIFAGVLRQPPTSTVCVTRAVVETLGVTVWLPHALAPEGVTFAVIDVIRLCVSRWAIRSFAESIEASAGIATELSKFVRVRVRVVPEDVVVPEKVDVAVAPPSIACAPLAPDQLLDGLCEVAVALKAVGPTVMPGIAMLVGWPPTTRADESLINHSCPPEEFVKLK